MYLPSGPCLATHTACSSSLVAAHLANAGLAAGEAGAAVAAGVFLILLEGTMAGICQLQVCVLIFSKLYPKCSACAVDLYSASVRVFKQDVKGGMTWLSQLHVPSLRLKSFSTKCCR